MNFKNISIALVILVASLSRLLPHPPNFTPIIAIGLFSGVYFRKENTLSLIIPIMAMIISDLFLGFHLISLFVYLSLIIVVFIGRNIKKIKPTFILLGSLSGSIVFFIISNFGVFLIGYPKSFAGLLTCYTAAIPFFYNSILGDLFFSGIIFLAYDVIKRTIPQINSDIA